MEVLAKKTGVLFENFLGIAGFDVYTYGVCIAIGFLLAYIVCTYLAKKTACKKDLTMDMFICAVVGAIVGARAYYVAFKWDSYFVADSFIQTVKNILDVRSGGLAIYGGIIGAIAIMAVYAAIKKENLLNMLDLSAAPLALGQAIGRWGNFFNQEAHGNAVTEKSLQFFPYAVYIDSPKGGEAAGWYQATFFYESLWCLLVFAFLMFVFLRQRKYYGQITLCYFALYGLERGIVEWLRTDQLTFAGGIPVSAILSILLCAASVTLLITARVKKYCNIPAPEPAEEKTEENK